MNRYQMVTAVVLLVIFLACAGNAVCQQAQANWDTTAFQAIRDTAASALARMEQPNFSTFKVDDVSHAFWQMFQGGFQMMPEWVEWFQSEVSRRSGNDVTLIVVKPDSNFSLIRGPANYFVLGKRMDLGPYAVPIHVYGK